MSSGLVSSLMYKEDKKGRQGFVIEGPLQGPVDRRQISSERWLPKLAISGRGNANFSLEGLAKGHFRLIAEKLCDRFYLNVALEQAGRPVHAPAGEILDGRLTYQLGEAS